MKSTPRLPLTLSCAALVNLGPMAIKDPNQWIRYSDQQIRGNQSTGHYRMKIETSNWTRELEMRAQVSGKDKAIIFIDAPPKEKGIGTLRLGSKMSNYFPKLRRAMEVSPSMLLSSWMGSDFTNDDLLKASSIVDDYTHAFLPDEKIQNVFVKVIENKLKSSSKAIWAKIVTYASKDNCLPIEERYYDTDGRWVRTLALSNVKTFDGHRVPSVWVMTPKNDLTKKTTLNYLDVRYQDKIPDSNFTMKQLTH